MKMKITKRNLPEIVLATTNKGKLRELREMLSNWSINVRGLDTFAEVATAREDADSFAGNARLKALHYGKLLGGWVLADDSGLQVDALQGAPGVHSARFAGIAGPGRDQANNEKLLQMLAETPPEKRNARFCCCLCLANGTEVILQVEGFLEGVITDEPGGNNGFGYDPIFYVPNKARTVAQMSAEEKNAISHRAMALRKLLSHLEPMLKKV